MTAVTRPPSAPVERSARSIGCVSALIMDDNAFDRRRLMRIANETNIEFFIKQASALESFGRALDEDKFDLVFVDLDLASSTTGFDLLPVVRAHDVNRDAAMIMIAGADQAETALGALRAGFSDYIDKGSLSPAALERATLNAVQKTRLSVAADTAEAQTRSIEGILASFAARCRQEMRPMLTRMLRHVRQIRAEMDVAGMGQEAITGVEQSCARIEEFLLDLSSLAKDGLLEETVKAEPVTREVASEASKQRATQEKSDPAAPIPRRRAKSATLFRRQT